MSRRLTLSVSCQELTGASGSSVPQKTKHDDTSEEAQFTVKVVIMKRRTARGKKTYTIHSPEYVWCRKTIEDEWINNFIMRILRYLL